MKILAKLPKIEKTHLAKKITVRWVQGRNVWQAYHGGRYISGANGIDADEAIRQLSFWHTFDEENVSVIDTLED